MINGLYYNNVVIFCFLNNETVELFGISLGIVLCAMDLSKAILPCSLVFAYLRFCLYFFFWFA